MEAVREKVLEKLSEALVACGDNTEYREYVTNLKAMVRSDESTKSGFLMFLSLLLNKMPEDCGACAALVSIKALLELQEEAGTEQSKTAPAGMETADDIKDSKLPELFSEAEIEELRRSFGVLTEEHGWTSANYGADLYDQGKVQRILKVKYGTLNTPVIGFRDNITGEYRVFVTLDHIIRETVAEGKVQPFNYTYDARETWWQCEASRYGRTESAKENTKTFQSSTMPGMGIRTLTRVTKQEVSAKHKRGDIVLCPPSWDMDTIDRLCQLTPNTKKGKGHKSYILLVELDTGGEKLQEIQLAPRVKTWGNASMPLWSPVVAHWNPNKKNLAKTSPQLMEDINAMYQSYCMSFADFMRATLLPGYWFALKTSSTSEDVEAESAGWVDKAPPPTPNGGQVNATRWRSR